MTRIYITISPGDYGPIQTLIICIDQINEWMCQNFLQLNKDKTEISVFSAKDEQLNVSAQLQTEMLNTTNQARNHGVVMESDLNLNSHIMTVTKLAYYNLKILRIKRLMSQLDLEKPAYAFLSLVGSTKVMVSLQVSRKRPSDSSSCFKTLLLKSSLFSGFYTGFLSLRE